MSHYSELAEQATIGSILKDGELVKETALRKEHFRSEEGQEIFDAIKTVAERNEPVDMISVFAELQNRGTIEKVGGISFLSDLANKASWGNNFAHYEKMVIDCWKRRKTVRMASDFQFRINNNESNDEIPTFIKQLQEVEEVGMDLDENLFDRLVGWYESRVSRTGEMSGIPTGFADLDKITGGYRDECLYVIAARPAVGKTALMLCSALKTAAKDNVTIIFSLEMPTEQLFDRMACTIAGINMYKLENPNKMFNEHDWQTFNAALAHLESMVKKGTLIIYDKPGMTIQEIRAKLRYLRRKHPTRKMVCMIDYLQLVRSANKHRDKRLEVSEVSGSLKEISRQNKMPVVALAQLNRGTENRNDKRPTMSDLKESGDTEQDADAIFLLYRDDYYDPESEKKNVVELIIGKNRHGATGTVELVFMKEISRYESLQRGPIS